MRYCLFIVCFLASFGLNAQADVKNLVGERIHDFDTVFQGDVVTHTFRVKNETGQDVKILDARILVEVADYLNYETSGEIMKAGQDWVLIMNYDTRHSCGQTTVTVVVETEKLADRVGSHSTTLYFRLHGQVEFDPQYFAGPRLEVESRIVDLGEVVQSTPIKGGFKVTNTGESAAWLLPKDRNRTMVLNLPNRPLQPGESKTVYLGRYTHNLKVGDHVFTESLRFSNCTEPIDLKLKVRVTEKPPTPNGGVAEIEFDETVMDLGELPNGTHRFQYRFCNTGSAPLIISHSKSSWGAMVASHPKEPIPPGECGVIDVHFQVRSGSYPLNKSVTVQSNAKSKPMVVLKLKGFVKDSLKQEAIGQLTVLQTELDLGSIPFNSSAFGFIEVKNTGPVAMQISAGGNLGTTRSWDWPVAHRSAKVGWQLPSSKSEPRLTSSRSIYLKPGESTRLRVELKNYRGKLKGFTQLITFSSPYLKEAVKVELKANLTDTKRQRIITDYDDYGFRKTVAEYQSGQPVKITHYRAAGDELASELFFRDGLLVKAIRYRHSGNIKAEIQIYDPKTGKKIKETYERFPDAFLHYNQD